MPIWSVAQEEGWQGCEGGMVWGRGAAFEVGARPQGSGSLEKDREMTPSVKEGAGLAWLDLLTS